MRCHNHSISAIDHASIDNNNNNNNNNNNSNLSSL